MNISKVLLVGYISVITLFFFYSFTQIDLSLTVSRVEFLQQVIRGFQEIGYFNRPLSTGIYIVLLMALFVFYFAFLFYSVKKKLSKPFVWKTVIISAVVLSFSYTAFSHDLFNYIFDAKIVTYYNQNPYEHKALDYPNDPMLSFMHWTHRVYPYGPVWLALTVPLSFIGLNIFIPTLILFKLLMFAGFLGSFYFVGKILQKIAPEKELFGLVFFGLNPLLLIESLTSAHLDIVMMFFALWAFYQLVQKRYVFAFLLLFVSIGIKFATVFLLPVFILVWWQQQKHKVSWTTVLSTAVVLMGLSVIAASMRTNFQPWYLVVALPFAALLATRYFIMLPTMIFSFAALLTYVPYLYLGNWDNPVPQILANMYMAAGIVSVVAVGVYYFYGVRRVLWLKVGKTKGQMST